MPKESKFDLGKLHGERSSSGKAVGDDIGARVERADGYEPLVQDLFKIQTFHGDKLKSYL